MSIISRLVSLLNASEKAELLDRIRVTAERAETVEERLRRRDDQLEAARAAVDRLEQQELERAKQDFVELLHKRGFTGDQVKALMPKRDAILADETWLECVTPNANISEPPARCACGDETP